MSASHLKRIAMLGHKRIPSREGGVEVVVGELSTRMAALGYDVTCFNRSGHHVGGAEFDRKAQAEYGGVHIKNVWTLDKKGLAAVTASFSAAIRAAFGKYDVVHFHAEGPCSMLFIPKLFGKKCIATIHGLDHKRAKWGKFASLYILAGEKCAARFADEIIVLSEGVRKYFLDEYNRETVFIPNGITRKKKLSAQEITRLYGLGENDYILFLGRLVPEKGVKYLIEAYKALNTDKKLVIAGAASDSAEHEAELKALAGQDGRIIFTGFVEGALLEELYSNAYVFALPSDIEGMPLSLLEAMSFGCCCVTSDIPECVDVTGEYALSFKRGSVEALREKLQMLCDSPHTVDLFKAKSSDYICQKYNWDDITAETLRLYGFDETSASPAALEEKELEGIAGK